jgi:hypothetical protein
MKLNLRYVKKLKMAAKKAASPSEPAANTLPTEISLGPSCDDQIEQVQARYQPNHLDASPVLNKSRQLSFRSERTFR